MMFEISRQMVRQNRSLYAGAFVALFVGVFLLGLAATTTAATIHYTRTHPEPGIPVWVTGGEDPPHASVFRSGADVGGLQAVLSMVATLSGFITVVVVASTFAFVVASRRRELGLLRLIGAAPGQVRRMIRAEALVVAVLASVGGSAAALAATPLLLKMASGSQFSPVRLRPASPWLPLLIVSVVGIGIAMGGAWAAARRASRVAPVEALREAALEARGIGLSRGAVGLLALGGGVVVLGLLRPGLDELVIPLGMGVPMLFIGGLIAVGPLVLPGLVRCLALPVARTVTGGLARSNVLASPRRSASLMAPVLLIAALAGSMTWTFSLLADYADATGRQLFTADLMVTGADGPAVERALAGTAGIQVVDRATGVDLILTGLGDADSESALGIEPASFTATRNVELIDGSLADLRAGTIAVTREVDSPYSKYQIGDAVPVTFLDGSSTKLRVVALVKSAFGVTPSFLIPRSLARQHDPAAVPDPWSVKVRPGTDPATVLAALRSRLGDGGHAETAEQWIDAQGASLRRTNTVGLLVLLGPAGLYCGIAIANSLLMGSVARRHEYVVIRLLGATGPQVRRMVMIESALVALCGLALAGIVSTAVALTTRHALFADLPGSPVSAPGPVLAGLVVGCLGVALVAALIPAAITLRQSDPADAITE
jgi:putative ABC transport system permease protein